MAHGGEPREEGNVRGPDCERIEDKRAAWLAANELTGYLEEKRHILDLLANGQISTGRCIEALGILRAGNETELPEPKADPTASDHLLADAQRRQMEPMSCGHPKRYEHIFLPGAIGCLICESEHEHKQTSEVRAILAADSAPFSCILNSIRELVELRRQVTPYKYPLTCHLCQKQIDDEGDLIYHGLGNCAEICSRCTGSGEEPKLPPRPKIICLCGSVRFFPYFQEANYRETMAGNIVLSVGFYPRTADSEHSESVGITPEQKIALDELYFRKIELADEILVLNVGGYIGESTAREIEHAKKLYKAIRYLEPKEAAGQ